MPLDSWAGRGIVYDPAVAARLLKRKDSEREKSRNKKISDILAVAVNIFAQEGISGFSIRRIASEAGISLSTLQHYFGTRDNLLVLTINSLLAGYIADYTDISRDTRLSPRERMVKVIDDLLQVIGNPLVCAFYVNLWPTATKTDPVADIVRESYTQYYEALTTIISGMRPELSLEKASTLSCLIGSQIDGLVVTRLIAPHGLPDWDVIVDRSKAAWLAIIDNFDAQEVAPAPTPKPARRARAKD
ncbi:TetR/AcrR family transcriptional regulator [Rhizorhabdus wittichii]|uniref:Transcriptional regulator, TetR family n=2 Tax=Rhizorhabdus wittichii TaxID=160791 RepID=A0A9J9HF11_RHIWR|nr:TetR/AcrR family transcriptional regulator [Rhizorhabdus wittichii]ABQ70508.1 transcriptional regulator, TetR family [Rhizorhabdus wittichii RW1]QTH21694.1 TetR/AcrR family transcriptional regulator [Rhizorhabdus wittichii]